MCEGHRGATFGGGQQVPGSNTQGSFLSGYKYNPTCFIYNDLTFS